MSYYGSKVHAKAFELAQAGFGTRFKTYRKTPMLQVQPSDLPMLGFYILREKRTPWGHANHAQPKFQHELTLGFSGAIWAETADQNKLYQLEDWMSELDEILLCNPKFVILTAGICGMDRMSQYAKVGETTLFEIRVEMSMEYQSDYPPNIPDDFETMHVTTEFPDKEHAESGTPQIVRVYDLEQNS